MRKTNYNVIEEYVNDIEINKVLRARIYPYLLLHVFSYRPANYEIYSIWIVFFLSNLYFQSNKHVSYIHRFYSKVRSINQLIRLLMMMGSSSKMLMLFHYDRISFSLHDFRMVISLDLIWLSNISYWNEQHLNEDCFLSIFVHIHPIIPIQKFKINTILIENYHLITWER